VTSVIDLSAREFAEGMSRALRDDFGNDPSMAKTIADLTGASLGAVRKWLAGENGPTGEYLLKLMGASDSVWSFVLASTNRDKHGEVMQARIRRALAIMEGREEP
jgi:transcriptional regulator with XRE-family HTH domain